MHPYVHRSIIYKSQYMEATYVSINRWMDKHVVYVYNGILNAKWNFAISNNTDGPGRHYS